MRGPISTHLFPSVPQASLRTLSWISSNKNIHITVSHPRHYATESPKGDPNRHLWIHYIALGLSSWISSKRTHSEYRPRAMNRDSRWAHYLALGLWRDASQEEIKKRYYELSRKHHPDVSQDSNSPEIFRRATEAYAVLGKKKTRRTYDQHEQLHSALLSALEADESRGASPSTPRPVDPTFWDPVRMGSSTFYRPPPGYWTVMNKLMRDREKSNPRDASSSLHTNTPSRDETERNETRNQSNDTKVNSFPNIISPILLIALGLILNNRDELESLFNRIKVRTRKVDDTGPKADLRLS